MQFLDTTKLHAGMILNMSTRGMTGGLIRTVLGPAYRELDQNIAIDCPNHDAMVVEHNSDLWIGESRFPWACLTKIADYNARISQGVVYNLRVLEPVDVSTVDQWLAADYWMNNIHGTWYDCRAVLNLGRKIIFRNMSKRVADWEWAWFCSEGLMQSYLSLPSNYPLNLWGKRFPTPLTTLKRTLEGRFRIKPQT